MAGLQSGLLLRPSFDFCLAKASAIQPDESVRLLAALRLKGEPICLQTFADGPADLYSAKTGTGKTGKAWKSKEFCLIGVPQSSGKMTQMIGRTEQISSCSLEDISQGPFKYPNLARCSVSFTVNVLKPNAQQRNADNVQRVAAVFIDLDGSPLPDDFPLKPTAVVESSPGRFHVYWAVHDLELSGFTAVQKYLASLYGGDAAVCDLARVMRLPGYWHGKREDGFLSQLLELNSDAQYKRADLLGCFDGLADALEAAEVAEAARLQKAADQLARAAVLKAEMASSPAMNRAAAQQKYGQTILLGELSILGSTAQGGRNHQLYKAAAALGECVAAGILEKSSVEAELTSVALAVGLDDDETASTIHSGLTAGMKKPRDLSNIGTRADVRKKKSLSQVSAVTAYMKVSGPALQVADQIPAPEVHTDNGKLDYSDAQVLSLLGLNSWGVVSPHSEQAHAIRLKAIARDDLMYVPGKDGREWHVWTSRHWRDGTGALALAKRYVNKLSASLAPETARLEVLAEVLSAADRQEDAAAMNRAARRHMRAAKATEENKRQRAVFDLSTVHFLAPHDAHELFALRPWVLGFQNGTLDGNEFREHRRDDYMLSLLRVPYAEDWQGGEWEEVLNRMTGGDVELAQSLQDVAGYILSGSSSQRVVFIAYGPARSGKSTFSALLETMLGDQANTIEPKHLSGDGVRGLLGSRLWNRRLGVCHEAGKVPIDSELLKTMSGGDNYTVKHLYKDEFTAQPTHALVLVANDPPRLDGLDPALRERVVALPFEYDLDPQGHRELFSGRKLEEVRREPHSALVREFSVWAAQGMRSVFRSRSIFLAPAVALATAKLWDEMGNEMGGFWETLKTSEISLGIGVRELRGRYVDWCGLNEIKALPSRKWDKACEAIGLDKKSTGAEWIWKWSRAGVAWPFDNLTSLTTSQKVTTGKSETAPGGAQNKGDISHGEFAEKTVKLVNFAGEAPEVGPLKVVF
ncbi:phage/plasmid primase, P4 family [Deinococcus psychrotolerans]|nr:phage/plasmid primase, P4 family [Deinococcus psychrotolerans]